eukprot:3126288-Pleurochrysis_carterae.AAC.3
MWVKASESSRACSDILPSRKRAIRKGAAAVAAVSPHRIEARALGVLLVVPAPSPPTGELCSDGSDKDRDTATAARIGTATAASSPWAG